MKLINILALLALLLIPSCVGGCFASIQAPTSASGHLQGTVSLYSINILEEVRFDEKGNQLPGKRIFAGTAFANSPHTLLTAGHICEDIEKVPFMAQKSVLVQTTNNRGEKKDAFFAQIIAWSGDPDVCLLESKNHGLKVLKLASDKHKLYFGDRGVVLGTPGGYALQTKHVIFQSIDALPYKFPETSEVWTGIIQPGFSGGPLLHEGRVVGLVSAASLLAEETIFAVPSTSIREWLKRLQ